VLDPGRVQFGDSLFPVPFQSTELLVAKTGVQGALSNQVRLACSSRHSRSHNRRMRYR